MVIGNDQALLVHDHTRSAAWVVGRAIPKRFLRPRGSGYRRDIDDGWPDPFRQVDKDILDLLEQLCSRSFGGKGIGRRQQEGTHAEKEKENEARSLERGWHHVHCCFS